MGAGEPAVDEPTPPLSATVVVPTIHGREQQLRRAIDSVWAQTMPAALQVILDENREGAAATRNRALEHVTTEWVAFLDDDDILLPNHLRACSRYARLTGVDVVYPGYEIDVDDPIGCFGLDFDAELLRRRNFIPVTTLCRTEAVRAVGGFQEHPDENGDPCEDWGLWLAMVEAGYRFAHLPQRTWVWHYNGGARAVARD